MVNALQSSPATVADGQKVIAAAAQILAGDGKNAAPTVWRNGRPLSIAEEQRGIEYASVNHQQPQGARP
jgi:hypothetical protein